VKKFASIALVILLIATIMVPVALADGPSISSPHRVTPPTPITTELPPTYGDSGFLYEAPAAPAEAPAPVYTMIKVTAIWAEGVAANYVSDAPFAKFVSVAIDDADVPADQITAVEGSTDVTISEDFMKTLAVGTHTIVIKSTDGQASATFAVAEAADASAAAGSETQTGEAGASQSGASAGAEQSAAAATDASGAAAAAATSSASTPKTGDDSHTILWAAISLVTRDAGFC
jgi:hypothetical protein